jgi:hypothetical protein
VLKCIHLKIIELFVLPHMLLVLLLVCPLRESMLGMERSLR